MPSIWQITKKTIGYDTFSGTWKEEIPIGSSVYDVILSISEFETSSAVYSSMPDLPMFLGIADRTRTRSEYALAVPLNWGDHGYLIFLKK